MSKQVIFTTKLVERTGQLGDVMASFLSEQITEIQKRIKTSFPDIEGDMVWKTVSIFATLEGTKIPLNRQDIKDLVSYSDESVNTVLDNLEKARILRLADGIYEIAHDTLALQIAQKRSSEERALLEVQKLLTDRFAAFVQTGTLLSSKELDYLDPYLSSLSPSKEEENFINKSKQVARRKRLLLIGITLGSFLILAAFSIYAYSQKIAAEHQQQLAEKARIAADSSAADALRQRIAADSSATEAERQKIAANQQRLIAEEATIAAKASEAKAIAQQKLAEQATKAAKISEANALQQQALAIKAKIEADSSAAQARRQKDLADKEKLRADKQTELAKEEEKKAKALQIKSLSSALAAKSAKMRYDPRIKALLAKEAFSLHQNTDEKLAKPEIYSALFQAVEALSPKYFDEIFSENKGAVRSITFSKDEKQLFTAGSSGELIAWNIQKTATSVGKPLVSKKTVLSKNRHVDMVLSTSPNGKWLALGGKGAEIELIELASKTSKILPLDKSTHVHHLLFTVDSENFLVITNKNEIIQYNIATSTFKKIAKLMLQVEAVALHPEGNLLAIGQSGFLKIFDLSQQKLINTTISPSTISALHYVPKSQDLIIGASNGFLQLAKLENNVYKITKQRKNHGKRISDLAINRGIMAAASYDGTVSLWKFDAFENEAYEPFILENKKPLAMSLQFINKAKQIVVSYSDGTVKFWTCRVDYLAEELCGLITKERIAPFTDGEYKQYINLASRDYADCCVTKNKKEEDTNE